MRRTKITLILLLALIICLPFHVHAYPLTHAVINYPSDNYCHGTTGERIFSGIRKNDFGKITIGSEFRYYSSTEYWNNEGSECFYDSYSKSVNILSLTYNNYSDIIDFNLRVPYIQVEDANNFERGVSSVLLTFSYELMRSKHDSRISLISGVKIPVYDPDDCETMFLLGTGSYDVPVILQSDFLIYNILCNVDLGYIFMGKSKFHDFGHVLKKNLEYGDKIFLDFAVIKEFSNSFALKLDSNLYNVFDSEFDGDDLPDGQWKITVSPGIIVSPGNRFKIELGVNYDVAGRDTFKGYAPVLSFQYFGF